jgi:hypothetical protein
VYNFKLPNYERPEDLAGVDISRIEICPYPKLSTWLPENLEFKRPGYNSEGAFTLRPWQVEPADDFLLYPRNLMVGAPQTGKSVIADGMAFYGMKVLRTNGIIAYTENETVETVFKDRITPMIKENPCLRSEWDGQEDSLTVKRVKLAHCIWRIASAFNENTMATFASGITIGSEVGKWKKVKFHPPSMLEGRQGSYSYNMKRTVFETSVFDPSDYMYQQVYTEGVRILHPHYECPHCKHWIEFTDSQIKVKVPTYRYAEVMQYKFDAVKYECPICKGEISEADRVRMSERVVWAAPAIDQPDFKQEPEVIYNGVVQGLTPEGKRPGVETICRKWPRMVDTGYKFWQNLAAYFKAKSDPVALKMYNAEIMSRYTSIRTASAVEIISLDTKIQTYRKNYIPDDVLIITAGIDSHDDRFNYVYVGWCYGCVWKILKHGVIPSKLSDYHGDTVRMYADFMGSLQNDILYWPSGAVADFKYGFIDRGGHRADDVDYIVGRYPGLQAYVGDTRVDVKKPVVRKSDNGNFYLGQTEILSDLTGLRIASQAFFLPADTSEQFKREILAQYRIKTVSLDGTIGSKRIYGGDDHFRDCLNYNEGIARAHGLEAILNDPQACETLKSGREAIHSTQIIPPAPQRPPQAVKARGGGSYYNRA